MKTAILKIVESSVERDCVSLRCPGGNALSVRQALTDAGFKPGEDVVILLKDDYEELSRSADLWDYWDATAGDGFR